MPGLTGLTSLYGTLDQEPAGVQDEGAYQLLEQGTPDESHGKTGDTSGQTWPAGFGGGYSGQGTYGEAGPQLEFATDALPQDAPGGYGPNSPIDHTPSSHGGAWPRPEMPSIYYPDTLAVVGDQLRLLHGNDQGGPRSLLGDAPGGDEAPTDTTTDRWDAPNENGLPIATGPLRGLTYGGAGASGHLGQADVDQGYGELNTLPEFQAGHSIRVVQHDRMPWDYTALGVANEGMWLGKHPLGTAQSFDGEDSPYGLQGNTRTEQLRPEIRGYPTDYAAPPAPTVVPDSPGNDVFASDGI